MIRGAVPDGWAGEAVETLKEDLARKDLNEGARRLGYREAGAVKGSDRNLLARWIRSRTKVSVKWITAELRCKTAPDLRSSISRAGRLMSIRPNVGGRLFRNITRTDPQDEQRQAYHAARLSQRFE